jgi:hypothetical protein
MLRAHHLAGIVAGLTIGACTADNPVQRNNIDAGVADLLPPPELQSVPSVTPREKVALRGVTEGARVVAQGSPSGTVVTAVLPGGSFCQDVAIKDTGTTTLLLYAIGGDGRVSEPREIRVERDFEAPQPANATCSGSEDPPPCAAEEICNSGVDDDCNGFEGDCDQACNGCVDDIFEPNDFPFTVPQIAPGTYQLQLCPCRDDWFAFHKSRNQRIRVTTTFSHAQMNLNMRLYRAGPGGNGTGDFLVGSFTTTNQEDIDYLVDVSGAYYLHIYALGTENRQGPYTLRIY